MRLHHSQNILKMKRSRGLTINQNPLLWLNNWNPLSHSMTANKPSHPHQKALEVDQSGVPDCAKKFNPQTITSLSPGRAPAPKGGSNVTNTGYVHRLVTLIANCVQLVYFHQCWNCTPVFLSFALFKLHILQLYQSYFLIQESHNICKTTEAWHRLACAVLHLCFAFVFGLVSKFFHHSICRLPYQKVSRHYGRQTLGWESLDTRLITFACLVT